MSGLAKRAPVKSGIDQTEARRRRIVTAIFIIYWLLIFEGALRKWFLPGLHTILYFVRDPFVIYVYLHVIWHKMWPRKTPTYIVGLALCGLFLVLALLQNVVLGLPAQITAIGYRNYFWYLPLAFIIGEHFKGQDLAKLCRQTLIIAIPIGMLTFLQFKSGPTSFVNKAFSDEAAVALVSRDIVRTYGTFTFTLGQVLFIGSIIAMVLALWLLPAPQRPIGRRLLWISTFAVLENLYVSGSRSAFFTAAFSLLAAMACGLVLTNRKQQLRCLVFPGLIAVVGAVLYVTVFSSAFEAMRERAESASANEGSTLARAVSIVTCVFEAAPRATFMGYGLGMGSNAGMFLAVAAQRSVMLQENELPRILTESGTLGLLYIGYRVWLFFWLLYGSIIATRRSSNPLPLMLFSFEGAIILIGQMTLQGTVNGYGWLFAGFCIAANRLGEKPTAILTRKRLKPAKPKRIANRILGAG